MEKNKFLDINDLIVSGVLSTLKHLGAVSCGYDNNDRSYCVGYASNDMTVEEVKQLYRVVKLIENSAGIDINLVDYDEI